MSAGSEGLPPARGELHVGRMVIAALILVGALNAGDLAYHKAAGSQDHDILKFEAREAVEETRKMTEHTRCSSLARFDLVSRITKRVSSAFRLDRNEPTVPARCRACGERFID